MKVVILAGGFGTRISEESVLKPKPMVEIGDKPILWHIMKLYSYYGYNEFVICCGYKQHMIKEWFADYYLHSCDVTFDFTQGNKMTVHNNISEPWKVTLVDTGLNTMTGGRIKRVKEHLNGEPFLLTYGDGVAVSTARAGNVIGGGDFAPDRIIPDCVRAVAKGEKIAVRNPHSTRPYQHVLEPLGAYLMIAQAQYENPACAGSYNVGPGDDDCITTGQLADLFCDSWGGDAAWENLYQGGPHEANFLKLDCSKIRTAFGWKPHWQVAQAVKETAVWYQAWLAGKDMTAFTDEQIRKYFTLQEIAFL